MSERSWLVKDFYALYSAAHRFSEACHGRGNEGPYVPQNDLDVQLARLKLAFQVCEAERQGAPPRLTEAERQGAPPRLTEAERKALNALHRWMHSPVGDDALIEEAQDYHEQLEKEDPAECERLTTEERIAWANLERYAAEATGNEEPTVELVPGPGVCRVCKCTDDDCRQCIEKTGAPCRWVEPDLCSACTEYVA